MTSGVACSHLDQVVVIDPPEHLAGCAACSTIRGRWLHLHMCQSCGKIGCCDSSPNRHARAHAAEERHPIARSIEPGETWSWGFLDEVMFFLRPK